MTPDEVGDMLSAIEVAWPQQTRPDGWKRVWMQALSDLPSGPAAVALQRLVRSHSWHPSVAQVREEVAAVLGLVPPEAPALGFRWAQQMEQAMMCQTTRPVCPHPAIKDAVYAYGGIDAVRLDPDGWRRWWAKQRTAAIRVVLESDLSETAAIGDGATVRELRP